MNFETARSQMLGQQIRAWEVLDERVLEVLRSTAREQFVPENYRDLAFADTEIPLAHGQYMAAPKMEGRMLQALQITSIDKVLEIGTGSGYLASCLAALAETVQSVDIYQDFVDAAADTLAAAGVGNVQLAAADAFELDHAAEFDVIAVTGSVPELDEHFIRMLRPEGRLFVIVGRPPVMEARLITMHPGGDWTEEILFETVIAPLLNAQRSEPFVL